METEGLEIKMDINGETILIKVIAADPLLGLAGMVKFVQEGYADSLAAQLMDPDGDWEEFDPEDDDSQFD